VIGGSYFDEHLLQSLRELAHAVSLEILDGIDLLRENFLKTAEIDQDDLERMPGALLVHE
jgi:hypothetical protein